MRIARSMGVRLAEPMDLSFLEPARPEFARGRSFLSRPARQEKSAIPSAARSSSWI